MGVTIQWAIVATNASTTPLSMAIATANERAPREYAHPGIAEPTEEQIMKESDDSDDLPSPNYSPPPYTPTQASIKREHEHGKRHFWSAHWDEEWYEEWNEEENEEWRMKNEELDDEWYDESWWMERATPHAAEKKDKGTEKEQSPQA